MLSQGSTPCAERGKEAGYDALASSLPRYASSIAAATMQSDQSQNRRPCVELGVAESPSTPTLPPSTPERPRAHRADIFRRASDPVIRKLSFDSEIDVGMTRMHIGRSSSDPDACLVRRAGRLACPAVINEDTTVAGLAPLPRRRSSQNTVVFSSMSEQDQCDDHSGEWRSSGAMRSFIAWDSAGEEIAEHADDVAARPEVCDFTLNNLFLADDIIVIAGVVLSCMNTRACALRSLIHTCIRRGSVVGVVHFLRHGNTLERHGIANDGDSCICNGHYRVCGCPDQHWVQAHASLHCYGFAIPHRHLSLCLHCRCSNCLGGNSCECWLAP